MDYQISCLKHGSPLKMKDLGCVHCYQAALAELRTRLSVADMAVGTAAQTTRRDVKREYFEKIKTIEFWDEVVNDDGPEGKEYALQVRECIQVALRRKDG